MLSISESNLDFAWLLLGLSWLGRSYGSAINREPETDRFLGSGVGDFETGASLLRFSTFKFAVLDDLIEDMLSIKFIYKHLKVCLT